jgi:hypothetical protein
VRQVLLAVEAVRAIRSIGAGALALLAGLTRGKPVKIRRRAGLGCCRALKNRCAWRSAWETVDHARTDTAAYIDTYHQRPHSGLAYRTPAEVAQTWRDRQDLQTDAT